MQHISTTEKDKVIADDTMLRHNKFFMSFFSIAALLLFMAAPSLSVSAEKKAKPQPQVKPQTKPQAAPAQKEIVINDANLQTHQKRVEELVKKGDFDNSLKIMLKIRDYAKEVLSTVGAIKGQYEKAVNDPSVPQKDKEDLFIKLTGLNQLIPRYTTLMKRPLLILAIFTRNWEKQKKRENILWSFYR